MNPRGWGAPSSALVVLFILAGCSGSVSSPKRTDQDGGRAEVGAPEDLGPLDGGEPDATTDAAVEDDTGTDAGEGDTGPDDAGPMCGNGLCEPGETAENCPTDCTEEPRCGNGICEGLDEIQNCSDDCYCGNGTVESAPPLNEQCDDGNTDNGDGCSSTCQTEVAQCGNGVREPMNGETCDDGNKTDGDGCSRRCLTEISPGSNPQYFAVTQPSGPPPTSRVVTVDPTTQFQTFRDWSFSDGLPWETGTDYARLEPLLPQVIAKTVQEGVNRIRLQFRSGFENDDDYFDQYICSLGNPPHVNCSSVNGRLTREQWGDTRYRQLNDNNDPNVANRSGFQFGELDFNIEFWVNDLRRALNQSGSHLYVNLNLNDFVQHQDSDFEYYDNPDEYAELVYEIFKHMDDKYGWVPDGFQIMLEPDQTFYYDPRTNFFDQGCTYNWSTVTCGDALGTPSSSKNWDPADLADAIVAAGDRLAAAGYRPEFIGPSTTAMYNVGPYIRAMISHNRRVMEYLREMSYHRYYRNVTSAEHITGDILPAFDWALAQGAQLELSMLEWWVSSLTPNFANNCEASTGNCFNYHDLHEDVKLGLNSAWQIGGSLVWIREGMGLGSNLAVVETNGTLTDTPNSYLTGQYSRNIRRGAVRIDARANQQGDNPLAFVNRDGTWAVVVDVRDGGNLSIAGLRAGRYDISYATRTGGRTTRTSQTITAGNYLRVNDLPGGAVLAVVGPL